VRPLIWERDIILSLIIALLVIWLAFVIIGFAIKTLFWLAIVGIVLFLVTGIFGAIRHRIS
jgi:hypothetical protein